MRLSMISNREFWEYDVVWNWTDPKVWGGSSESAFRQADYIKRGVFYMTIRAIFLSNELMFSHAKLG